MIYFSTGVPSSDWSAESDESDVDNHCFISAFGANILPRARIVPCGSLWVSIDRVRPYPPRHRLVYLVTNRGSSKENTETYQSPPPYSRDACPQKQKRDLVHHNQTGRGEVVFLFTLSG